MSRPILFISLALWVACGCSTTEEQAALSLDRIPSTVPSPSVTEVSLLPGYHAEVVVSLLNYPSSITFDPMGNLYIAESGAAPGDESRPPRILRIAPGGQIDIMSDKVQTPLKQLEWRDGQLFVWHGEKISTLDHEGQLRDAPHDIAAAADRTEEKITDLTAAFGRPGEVLRIAPPAKDHGGQVLRIDPRSRRSSVFFCARSREKESSIAGAGPRRPIDLAFSADGRALYIVDFGASMTAKNGVRSFPETGVIWRIVKDGTTVSSPPPNLAPPPQIERRPLTGIFLP